MKTTARFELQRHQHLKELFTKQRLTTLWRKLVFNQMRLLDIKDLHDYYDFNLPIESRVAGIIERVLSGQYRAEIPLLFRSEKKLGVSRHLLIPSPSDAIVFQVLTDALYDAIVSEQPSKQAFYARDRHNLKLPHEDSGLSSYPWFVLWPQFQQSIWNFSKSHKYLVSTDLTNYFDSIGLRELRHVVSAIAKTKEVYLDLLFSLIENLSWNPDYLPISNKGLPTINIEAPRLLAHALLFEVDYLLKERTRDCFVRWMDDIVFGVSDLKGAAAILGEISDVLKSRGLSLNLSKTTVLTAREVRHHFLFKENLRLNGLFFKDTRTTDKGAKKRLARKLAKELRLHVANCTSRNKDKLTKRYLTVLATLRIPVAVTDVV